MMKIRSEIGVADLGDGVTVMGKDLHRDFGMWSPSRFMILMGAGVDVGQDWGKVFDELRIGNNFPDPRIWCNRVAYYCGKAGVSAQPAAFAAGFATTGTKYGVRTTVKAAEALIEASEAPDFNAWFTGRLRNRRVFYGYRRPVIDRDERVPFALRTLKASALKAPFKYLALAFRIERELQRAKGVNINISGVHAALLLDAGVPAERVEAARADLHMAGFVACWRLGAQQGGN